jgi:hypothetical protein
VTNVFGTTAVKYSRTSQQNEVYHTFVRRTKHFGSSLWSGETDIRRLVSLGATAAFEGHALVLGKGFEPLYLNILEVHEKVCPSCVWGDEAEAFGFVEPFHGAGLSRHDKSSIKISCDA